jgi:hypothetical protein
MARSGSERIGNAAEYAAFRDALLSETHPEVCRSCV